MKADQNQRSLTRIICFPGATWPPSNRKAHCVLSCLLFRCLLPAHPSLTSKHNKLFWADISSIRPSRWMFCQMPLLGGGFLSPHGECTYLFPHFPVPTTQQPGLSILSSSPSIFLLLRSFKHFILLMHSTLVYFQQTLIFLKKSLFFLSYRMSLPLFWPLLSPVPLHGWPLKWNAC